MKMNKISNISHLILSGGGGKGIAYLGIMRYLYLEGMMDKIKYINGTSMGAFFAVVLALKIPSEIIEEEMNKMRANLHISTSCNKTNLSNILVQNGILNLEFMINPVRNYIKTKYGVDDLTFIEFVKKTGVNLYIKCTNVNMSQAQYFSLEETPDKYVLKALEASMSVPFIFQPVRIDDQYYMDGLVCDFDFFKDIDQSNLLRIKLPGDAKSKPLQAGCNMDLFDYSQRVTQIMLGMLFNEKYEKDDTIFNVGPLTYEAFFRFKFTDKDAFVEMTQEDFDDMIIQGFVYMSQYMSNRFSAQLAQSVQV